MARAPGLSVRLKLTLSYAGFLMLAGVLLLAAVWVFLLRYVPDRALLFNPDTPTPGVFPIRSNLLHVVAPRAAAVLAFLLVFGLVGGWILAGRMLAPLDRITDATRVAATGSLAHRIRLPGRSDEFRELVLRLRALDRRRAHNRPPVREIAGLRLDPFRREVYRDGRYVALTRKQFAVLEVLVAAEGGVVSAEELLRRAWDENADPFTNAVRITVSALRKRLGEPWIIATVPGIGYRIDAQAEGDRG